MGSLIWYPPSTSGALAQVAADGSGDLMTFAPGIPQDVPQQLLATVTAALQALGGNLVSPTPSVVTTLGGTTTQTYEVVALNGNGDTTPSSTVSTTALATPTGLTVTPTGTPGITTYGYRVSATNASGETLAETEVTTATGNATLTGVNYNALAWTAVPGATGYRVYGRTSGAELFLAATATTSYNDTGAATPSGALPAGNTTGGPATLDATHFNTLTWAAATGATGYKVVRTVGGPSQGLIATLPAATLTLVDNGLAGTTYTPAGAPVSQSAVVAGPPEI